MCIVLHLPRVGAACRCTQLGPGHSDSCPAASEAAPSLPEPASSCLASQVEGATPPPTTLCVLPRPPLPPSLPPSPSQPACPALPYTHHALSRPASRRPPPCPPLPPPSLGLHRQQRGDAPGSEAPLHAAGAPGGRSRAPGPHCAGGHVRGLCGEWVGERGGGGGEQAVRSRGLCGEWVGERGWGGAGVHRAEGVNGASGEGAFGSSSAALCAWPRLCHALLPTPFSRFV